MNWAFVRQVGFGRWFVRYGTLQFRKRVLRLDTSLRLPTGAKLTLPRHQPTSSEAYVTNGNVDWGAEEIFARFADPARDFLDIGAYIGYYALYLAPVVRRVYAFEPSPRNHPHLLRNANNTDNIEVVQMAVSSHGGEADFFDGGGHSVGSLENVGGEVIKVRITSVDSFLQSHPKINPCLIKTDIEGHDLTALKGMQMAASKFQPLMLTECGLSEELILLCSSWNYKIFATLRDRHTNATKFRELTSKDVNDCWHKMLFLVPSALQTTFAELASE
jgi:FkbM family methyltransferase